MMKLALLVLILGVACAVHGLKCPEKSDKEEDEVFEKIAEKDKDVWDKVEKETAKNSFAFRAKTKEDRKAIFKKKAKEAKEANKKNPKFCQEPQELDTLEDDEVAAGFEGLNPAEIPDPKTVEADSPPYQGFGADPAVASLPKTVDHSDATGVVESQGGCGSCWAFCASHTVTGVAKLMGNLGVNDYSEQQLTDCVYPSKGGCQGGWPMAGFQYLQKKPFMPEPQYPYTGKSGANMCKDQKASGSPVVIGQKYAKGEAEMMKVLAKHPMSVAMYVGKGGFGRYRSGVYDYDGECPGVNHGMTLVGYGTDPEGGKYWLIKNSWGGNWGDKGFIKVARGKNLCQVESYGMYPIVKEGGGGGGSGDKTTKPQPTEKTTAAPPSSWKKYKTIEYIYPNTNANFELAEQFCMQNRGNLPSITSEAKLQLIRELAWSQLRVNGRIWIGLHDRKAEGTWEWTDGSPVSYTHWGRGEPNDWRRQEDCTEMDGNGYWNDLACTNQRKYICVK